MNIWFAAGTIDDLILYYAQMTLDAFPIDRIKISVVFLWKYFCIIAAIELEEF